MRPAREIEDGSRFPAAAGEITVKYGIGTLQLPERPSDRFVPLLRQRAGIDLLPIGEPEVCQVHKLRVLPN